LHKDKYQYSNAYTSHTYQKYQYVTSEFSRGICSTNAPYMSNSLFHLENIYSHTIINSKLILDQADISF